GGASSAPAWRRGAGRQQAARRQPRRVGPRGRGEAWRLRCDAACGAPTDERSPHFSVDAVKMPLAAVRHPCFRREDGDYMLRRYSPPTSYNAWLICPSECVFTASISEAKTFWRSRAVFCRY